MHTDTPYNDVVSAVLVTIQYPGVATAICEEHLEELKGLVGTLDFEVRDASIVKVASPRPRYLVGSGKAEEIASKARDLSTECIVFDDELSPSQQRNWEQLTGLAVIDRHEVILEIFAARASTREAALQVGLARMEYSLPRLTRAWTHLSRQHGGARGTRGEGETQLEMDRRVVLRKIGRLKGELERMKGQRDLRRRRRAVRSLPVGSVVGYTNAGKSSLLNVLSGSNVLTEDKLFATLDPTTRKVSLRDGREVLLTDTVGFIRKLPHDLVMAFRSTLEETVLSDFLINVLDLSNSEVEEHQHATLAVLEELGARDKPIITVFNKIDRAHDTWYANHLQEVHPDAVYVSAKTGQGMDDLIAAIARLLSQDSRPLAFALPSSRHDLLALLHRTGTILETNYEDGHILVSAQVPDRTRNLLAEYIAG